jgi:hypothetical protein
MNSANIQKSQPSLSYNSTMVYPIPKNLEFLDEEDEKKKCIEFKDHLVKF